MRARVRFHSRPHRAARMPYRAVATVALALTVLAACAQPASHAPTAHDAQPTATASPAGRTPITYGTTCAPVPDDLAAPGPYPVGVTQHTFANTSAITGAPRPLPSVIWYPAAASARATPADPALDAVSGAPAASGCAFPVIVFSHGFMAAPQGASLLLSHLASEGFVVVAPHHPDGQEDGIFDYTTTAGSRPGDLSAVIDQLPRLDADPTSPLHNLMDLRHIGVAGHSFGGLTAELTGVYDTRVQAVLSMAPGWCECNKATTRIGIPIVVMVGDQDTVIWVSDVRLLYTYFPPTTPHALIVLHGAGHGAFVNSCGGLPNTCAVVARYATAFFLAFLAGDRPLAAAFDPSRPAPPGVTIQAGDMP